MHKLLALGSLVLLTLGTAASANAEPITQTTLVKTNPVNWTPRVVTGLAVYKMLQVGSTMYAGGDFSKVEDSGRSAIYTRINLFSFDATTGALNPFALALDGPVWGLASDGTSLWVGGEFKHVNGVARRGLAKVNPTTGALDTSFDAGLDGNVQDVQLIAGRLIVGGKLTRPLQAVDPATGADTHYLDNLPITGTISAQAGPTDIYRFAVDPAGTHLVGVGNFTTVAGVARPRAFMADLGLTSVTLNPWSYAPMAKMCSHIDLPAQLRDVDFSPDGSYFVMVATGFIPNAPDQGVTICDAAARFNTNAAAPYLPVWINYTGGDTLESVAVTDAAVYIQGHNRWVSSKGRDCTPGCVAREGIAALAPANGAALNWNPTKTRGIGGKDLLLTPAGLWVASDGTAIGGEIHERLALLPL
jgi:hypothetical protein